MESGDGRSVLAKAMLVVRKVDVAGDVWQDDFLKGFGKWRAKRYGSVGSACCGIFARFGNRKDFCGLPLGGNVVEVKSGVVDLCEILYGTWTEMFEVSDIDRVWTS